MNTKKIATIIGILVLAIILRYLPHPPNFSPVTAIALFGGAYFSNRLLAFLAPMAVMFCSDFLIQQFNHQGFHWGMWLVYGAFAVVTLVGIMMQNKITVGRVVGSSITGSLVFFLITNFALFYPETSPTLGFSAYPHTFEGVMASYTAGLPFLQNALIGDLFYTAILFGGFYLLQKRFPVLKTA